MAKLQTPPQKIFIEASVLCERHISGIGRTVQQILQTWADDKELRRSFEPVLVVPFDLRARLEALSLPFAAKYLPFPSKLLRALRRFDLVPPLDLVLGQGIYLFPNYWNWRLARSRSLTYVYDVGFLVHPEFVEPQNQRFLASHIGRWLRRTDGVLTISDHAKAEIVEHCQLDPSRVHVIYNGVDTAPYANTRKDQIAAVKAKHDIQGDYLLFVGNIEPRKNMTRLIEAYTQLPEEQRDRYELLLVGGDGWNNQPILRAIAAAQQKGFRIRKLPTFVSNKELPALYAGATVLTSPSLYEGFGMTPLEAMAAGTPVVVGDNSSLPEVVGEAG